MSTRCTCFDEVYTDCRKAHCACEIDKDKIFKTEGEVLQYALARWEASYSGSKPNMVEGGSEPFAAQLPDGTYRLFKCPVHIYDRKLYEVSEPSELDPEERGYNLSRGV